MVLGQDGIGKARTNGKKVMGCFGRLEKKGLGEGSGGRRLTRSEPKHNFLGRGNGTCGTKKCALLVSTGVGTSKHNGDIEIKNAKSGGQGALGELPMAKKIGWTLFPQTRTRNRKRTLREQTSSGEKPNPKSSGAAINLRERFKQNWIGEQDKGCLKTRLGQGGGGFRKWYSTKKLVRVTFGGSVQ